MRGASITRAASKCGWWAHDHCREQGQSAASM